MLGGDTLDIDALRAVSQSLLAAVLEEFTVVTRTEGENLRPSFSSVPRQSSGTWPKWPPHAAGDGSVPEKLATRLKEALGNADEDRIRQEWCSSPQIDVDEELTRLTRTSPSCSARSTKAAQ